MKKIFTLFTCTSIFFSANSQVVISQIYGGGGNTGATYKNDFVELFNYSNSAISLSGYSVQYASATGSFSAVNTVALTGSIGAYGYYLIQFASGGTPGSSLPTADIAGSTNLSATGGKVALLSNTTALGGTCPTPPPVSPVVDFVGYGISSNVPTCYFGSSYAPGAPSGNNATASLRKYNGITNTNDNSADFATGTPNPRNSSQILPLQLLSFSATPKESTITFNWKTTNERNTHHFDVEQSFDGANFKSIGTVTATGNTTTEKSYSYTASLNASITYYRLKMVDADGKNTLSSVVKIAPSKTGFSLGNVYPIPARNSITVEWNSRTSGATALTLTDMTGRTVRTLSLQSTAGFNQYRLDVNSLPAGQYFLRLKNDLNQVQTIVTKQ